MKIYIAHDKPPADFEEDLAFQALLQEADLWFHRDKVQAKSTSSIGWLLGSTPDSCNINDMKMMHEAHPDLGIECEPRPQNIRLYPGKNTIPSDQQVKAIRIYVASDNVTKARQAYNQVYGSGNTGGYPGGQMLCFIPDISDPRYPASMQTRSKVIRMMSKQKHLLESTVAIPTSTIAGLHVFDEEIGMTLCQILMSLRLGDAQDVPMFLSVEERQWGASSVVFSVKRDRLHEANSVIPLLCVIIEAKFGTRSKQWFTEDARITSEGFYWDNSTQQLKQSEDAATVDDDEFSIDSNDSYVATLTAALNIGDTAVNDTGGVFNFDLNFVLNDEIMPKNQYGDHGSVQTFRASCEHINRKEKAFLQEETTAEVRAETNDFSTEFTQVTPSSTLTSGFSSYRWNK
jgi:hypothetical protein